MLTVHTKPKTMMKFQIPGGYSFNRDYTIYKQNKNTSQAALAIQTHILTFLTGVIFCHDDIYRKGW
jgi:hypothetical protein